MNTVTSHHDAKIFNAHLGKRREAHQDYNRYMKEKSFLFRHSVSIGIFFILVIPITLAFIFSSMKPLTISVLSIFAYFVLSARISNDIEKSFEKDFPEKAALLFPKE
jgi:hypothetical protein